MFATVSSVFPESIVSAYLGSVQRSLPHSVFTVSNLLSADRAANAKMPIPTTPTPAVTYPSVRTVPPRGVESGCVEVGAGAAWAGSGLTSSESVRATVFVSPGLITTSWRVLALPPDAFAVT